MPQPRHWAGLTEYESHLEWLVDLVKTKKTLEAIGTLREFLHEPKNLKMVIEDLPQGVWAELMQNLCKHCGNASPCYCQK